MSSDNQNFKIFHIDTTSSQSDLCKSWNILMEKIIPECYLSHPYHNSNVISPLFNDHNILKNICKILEIIEAQSVILEYDYVDRTYLQDFQRYHLSCYQHYKKTCLRLHFFKENWQKNQLTLDFINSDKYHFNNNENYLGNIIIRPLPNAFIGRVHLKISDNQFCKLIDSPVVEQKLLKIFKINPEVSAHLFGVKFKLNSLVYLQQDRSIGACSPTSLWIALNALKEKWDLGEIPAISQLIEMNTNTYDTGNRSFPNSGLYIPQIEYLIKKFHLEPDYISPKKFFYGFEELIYAYLRHRIPIILIIELWQSTNPNDDKSKHNSEFFTLKENQNSESKIYYDLPNISHMCVISGIIIDEKPKVDSQNIRIFQKNQLKHLLIHDDRIGPYQIASTMKIELIDGYKRVKDLLKIEYQNSILPASSFWAISGILIPTHPKIRVSYQNAKQLYINFFHSLTSICEIHISQIKEQIQNIRMKKVISLEDNDIITKLFGELNFYKIFNQIHDNIICDMYLSTTNEFKSQVLHDYEYIRSPDIKWKIVSDNLPRFVWIISCSIKTKDNWIFDLIIDATDIDPPYLFYRIYLHPQLSGLKDLGEMFIGNLELQNSIQEKWNRSFSFLITQKLSNAELCALWKNLVIHIK